MNSESFLRIECKNLTRLQVAELEICLKKAGLKIDEVQFKPSRRFL